ncbi:hypothetical protein JW887_04335 [Candidatus Dojkabacteria bacterium]|nr:hypothetical protein [Candidatus Dojkabacteria bacterium]
MFENLIKELNNLDGTHTVSIPINPDEDGYIDKECPNNNCKFVFKVNQNDWANIFRDEEVFCPMCGKGSLAENFFTTEQIEAAKQKAVNNISARLGTAIKKDSRKFNSKYVKGFIQMRMQPKGFHSSTQILPISAQQKIERKIKCSKCNSRYAVIGSAYFCPSCGFNDIDSTFDDSMASILFKIENTEKIKEELEKIDRDQAKNTARELLETSIKDIVSAFQRFCEHKFKNKYPKIKLKMNVFQRPYEGSSLWNENLGQGYQDWLSKSEFNFMFLMFKRRHLLEHQQGIVDQKYLHETTDSSYQIGERLVITSIEAKKFYDIVLKIINKIKSRT